MLVTDTDSSKSHGGGKLFIDVCPCLSKSRCDGRLWLLNLNRKMTITEMARLQGFPDNRLKFPVYKSPVVNARRYCRSLADASTVSVVGRVALRLLRAIGIASPEVRDPWQQWAEAGGCAAPPPGRRGGSRPTRYQARRKYSSTSAGPKKPMTSVRLS